MSEKGQKNDFEYMAARWHELTEYAELVLEHPKALVYALKGLVRAARALEIAKMGRRQAIDSAAASQRERFEDMHKQSGELVRRYYHNFAVQHIDRSGETEPDKPAPAFIGPAASPKGKGARRSSNWQVSKAERAKIEGWLGEGLSVAKVATLSGRGLSTVGKIKTAMIARKAAAPNENSARLAKIYIRDGKSNEEIAINTGLTVDQVESLRPTKKA